MIVYEICSEWDLGIGDLLFVHSDVAWEYAKEHFEYTDIGMPFEVAVDDGLLFLKEWSVVTEG